MLPSTATALLRELLDSFMRNGQRPTENAFLRAHSSEIPTLRGLVDEGSILQDNERYAVSLRGLASIPSEASERLVGIIDTLRIALRKEYEQADQPKIIVARSRLKEQTALGDNDLKVALFYGYRAFGYIDGGSDVGGELHDNIAVDINILVRLSPSEQLAAEQRRLETDRARISRATSSPPDQLVFISYDTRELAIAAWVKNVLSARLPAGSTVFVAKYDIGAGADPMRVMLEQSLLRAEALVALCSERSYTSPWLWWESSAAWARGKLVVPLFIDVEPAQFRGPLTTVCQGRAISDSRELNSVVDAVVKRFDPNAHVPPLTDAERAALDVALAESRKSSAEQPTLDPSPLFEILAEQDAGEFELVMLAAELGWKPSVVHAALVELDAAGFINAIALSKEHVSYRMPRPTIVSGFQPGPAAEVATLAIRRLASMGEGDRRGFDGVLDIKTFAEEIDKPLSLVRDAVDMLADKGLVTLERMNKAAQLTLHGRDEAHRLGEPLSSPSKDAEHLLAYMMNAGDVDDRGYAEVGDDVLCRALRLSRMQLHDAGEILQSEEAAIMTVTSAGTRVQLTTHGRELGRHPRS